MNTWIAFFKAHERFILVVVCILFSIVTIEKGLTFWERHDQRVFDKDKAALVADADKNAADARNSAVLAQQYADLAKQVLAENAQLEKNITARDMTTRQQQDKDQTLPPSELADRWQSLEGLPIGSIGPTATGSFTVTDTAARTTVKDLEQVPQLRQDLNDTRKELSNKTEQVARSEAQVTGLQVQVTGLGQTLTDQTKACKAEVALVKAKARRSKFKIALIAYGAGVLTRSLVTAIGF